MPTSTVTSRGQTTVPKEIRTHLGLQSGDRIEYTIDREGRVIITPSTVDISELDGMLAGRVEKPISIEKMQQAIESEASGSVRRT